MKFSRLWWGLFLLLSGCAGGTPVAPVVPVPPTVIHHVSLNWHASAGPDVYVGYNVYRALTPAGPWTKVTPQPINQLDFDDLLVHAGQSYAYYVTAIDTAAAESVPSAVVVCIVPTP